MLFFLPYLRSYSASVVRICFKVVFFQKADYVKVKACSGITLFSLSVDTKIPEESRNVKHDLLITKQILKKKRKGKFSSK